MADSIAEEYQFPLSGAVEILEACCALQGFPLMHLSFIGLTADYKKSGGTPRRTYPWGCENAPGVVILVSDSFQLDEAILFWNLRASEIYVAWLSFAELESNLDAVATWLDSDHGGGYYSMRYGLSDIAFSAPAQSIDRLKVVVDKLKTATRHHIVSLKTLPYVQLVLYNYEKPHIEREQVIVLQEGSRCTFLPEMSQECATGVFVVKLAWDGLMLPQSGIQVRELIPSGTIQGFPSRVWIEGREARRLVFKQAIAMPRFRITKERHLNVQVNSSANLPIEFNRPSPERIIENLFTSSGFSRIEPSSAAKYHKDFVDRAGGLEEAARYLAISPYRELRELLSDNSDKNKDGWILERPDKRRALRHFDLRTVLGESTPSETQEYLKVADHLPDVTAELLAKGILERGFRLKCDSCSFKSWYPADYVGQEFTCSRCFTTQVYTSNPLWLYKLREVVFQGFADNMQVPLLALDYLRRRSQHFFEWVPDSNVYWEENDSQPHRNIDVLCLCDGKFYLGEAKSNDSIESKQFLFYRDLCSRVPLNGIVFATSTSEWKEGTHKCIWELRDCFEGEVLELTSKELYSL